MASSRDQAPPDISTVRLDEDYDYKVSSADRTPSIAAAEGFKDMQQSYQKQQKTNTLPIDQMSGEEALMDLAQLEELQHEAERMKALGNKHMAAQVRYCLSLVI